MLQNALGKVGVYYAKRKYMPRGIDWLWDLRRIYKSAWQPVVFDVGANIGQTTQAVLRTFPAAQIHAFEPVTSTFSELSRNTQTAERVICHRLGLSSVAGTASMSLDSNSQLSHINHTGGAPTDQPVEVVEVITVDDYCRTEDVRHIHLLKTDTEGHDLAVLQGAERSLEQGIVDWLLVEVSFTDGDCLHSQFTPINRFLTDLGLEMYCFYDHYFDNTGRRLMFCNALFTKIPTVVGCR